MSEDRKIAYDVTAGYDGSRPELMGLTVIAWKGKSGERSAYLRTYGINKDEKGFVAYCEQPINKASLRHLIDSRKYKSICA